MSFERKVRAVVVVFASLGFVGCDGQLDAPQKRSSDAERIQGTWEVVSLQSGGKTFDKARGDVWVINDREMFQESELLERDEPLESSELRTVAREYQLDSAKKHIDWSTTQEFKTWRPANPDGPGVMDPHIERMSWHRKGIYQLDGDRLKLCFGDESFMPQDAVRPEDFVTKDGDRRSVFVLQRRLPDAKD